MSCNVKCRGCQSADPGAQTAAWGRIFQAIAPFCAIGGLCNCAHQVTSTPSGPPVLGAAQTTSASELLQALLDEQPAAGAGAAL